MNRRHRSTAGNVGVKAVTAKAGDRPRNLNNLEAPPIKGSEPIEVDVNNNENQAA